MDAFNRVRRSPLVFPLACVAVIVLVSVSEGSYQHSMSSLEKMEAAVNARGNLRNLVRSLVDAETGQRGYLLTGQKEYLEPYNEGLAKVGESFKLLDDYYANDPKAMQIMAQLHALTEVKLSELALTIGLRETGKVEASTDITLSGIGKSKMDSIRALGDDLIAKETATATAGQQEIHGTLMFNRIGVAVLSVISLGALFMYLRQTMALEKEQQEQRRMVQAERDRLEVEVINRTAQLTELADHLQTAREDERSRLARDLHDELGALLTSAKLDAARIKARLAGTAPEAVERLSHLVGTLNSGIALKRRIIEDLRPSSLSHLGLVGTLEILTREFAERSGIQVYCSLAPVTLEADAELMIYRVVQEAITNITKYARARTMWVSLAAQSGSVKLSVRDDGDGFDTSVQPRSSYGLVGMRYRVEAEGGTLNLTSAPGQGTLIQVTLPESSSAEV